MTTPSFFSPAGRSPPVRFLLWTAALAAGLLVGVTALRHGGYLVSIVVGAIWGGAIAKLRAELVRRLRDGGFPRGAGLLTGGIGIAGAFGLLAWWIANGPGPVVWTGLAIGAVLLAFVTLRSSASVDRPSSEGNGLAVALLFTVAGAGLGYAVANWSAISRVEDEAAAARAETYQPPPDPLGGEQPEDGQVGNAEGAGR